MEADKIQCNFPRISDTNNRLDDQYPDEEDEGDNRRGSSNGVDLGGGLAERFYGWPSSRIVRVSRTSGGKDRHSKVLTSRGPRDRRVRLSVNTAIQFYDLQDRLGYDQPSKAVEWLLRAAASSIAELPPMNSPFPDTPKQSSTAGSDQLGFDSAEADPNYSQQKGTTNTKSSACSSTSETSKGSGLSLSRSESRMKARERAKERVAAEKEKEKDSESASVVNPISQATSFTQLLNGGMSNAVSNTGVTAATTTSSPDDPVHQNHGGGSNESNFFLRSPRQWAPATPMDYFSSGLLGQRSGQMHMSTNPFTVSPAFNVVGEHHPELLQFSFVTEHLVNGGNGGGNINAGGNNTEYNLNFRISSSSANPSSSGLAAGFKNSTNNNDNNNNRGTLQSNSTCLPSLSLPHLQRFPDGPPPPSFFVAPADNHNHHSFLSGLQLCYGNDDNRDSRGQKGKGKK